MSKVESFLAHYASQYYDPAKAREYYLKNRKLKGRKSGTTEKLTAKQRQKQAEATAYVSNKIGTEKKTVLTKAAEAQKARLEKLRTSAEETRKRIDAKFDALLASMTPKEIPEPTFVKVDRPTIPPPIEPPQVKRPEVRLNPIPVNASPRVKALLRKQNASLQNKADKQYEAEKKVADATYQKAKADRAANILTSLDQYKADKEKADADNQQAKEEYQKAKSESVAETRDARSAAKNSARAEMMKAGTDLKTAVTEARAAYAKSRKETVDKYKKTLDKEITNIQKKVR